MKKKTSKRKTKKRRPTSSSKGRKTTAKDRATEEETRAEDAGSERPGSPSGAGEGAKSRGEAAARRDDSLAPALPCRAEPGQFLTFLVGGDEYAIPILESREIVELGACAEVPSTPEWMLGLMNLRGAVIPIVDLSAKLGISREKRRGRSAVIVVQPKQGGEEAILGILVEDVREVAPLSAEQLEPVPSFGSPIRADCLLGLGQHDERVLLLLDIHRTLSVDELLSVSHLAADAEEPDHDPERDENQDRGEEG